MDINIANNNMIENKKLVQKIFEKQVIPQYLNQQLILFSYPSNYIPPNSFNRVIPTFTKWVTS
jgi:hypothetical protein